MIKSWAIRVSKFTATSNSKNLVMMKKSTKKSLSKKKGSWSTIMPKNLRKTLRNFMRLERRLFRKKNNKSDKKEKPKKTENSPDIKINKKDSSRGNSVRKITRKTKWFKKKYKNTPMIRSTIKSSLKIL